MRRPVDEDDNEHGTHVAGTIGSPSNGQGIAGVAPAVTLVNVRAGQDSGYFFLQPTLDALTYAGFDVVNMSFYIDPWLVNCTADPADSPEEQQEQRTIVTATLRALKYAHKHDVTLVAALGNEETDLGHPTTDLTSPDYPATAAHARTIDNSCLSLPAEGRDVIGVTSVGPSLRTAYYSNYGIEQADVAAPGVTTATSRAPTGTAPPPTWCWRPTRRPSPRPAGCSTPTAAPTARSSSATTAPTTSTCRARRWPRRTPPASPRSPSASGVTGTASSVV